MDGELDDGVNLLVLVLHPIASQVLVEASLLLLDGLQGEGGADTGQILTIQLSQKSSVRTKFGSKENNVKHCTGKYWLTKEM